MNLKDYILQSVFKGQINLGKNFEGCNEPCIYHAPTKKQDLIISSLEVVQAHFVNVSSSNTP